MSNEVTRVPLRNVTVEDRMRATYTLTFAVLRTLWPLVAILFVFTFFFSVSPSFLSDTSDDTVAIIINLLVVLGMGIVIAVLFPSVIVLANDIADAKETRAWTQIVREGWESTGTLIWMTIVYVLVYYATKLGTALFIESPDEAGLIGLLLVCAYLFIWGGQIYWNFYPFAVIIAKQRGINAFTYSYNRVKGHWFDALMQEIFLYIALIISAFPLAIVGFIVALPLYFLPELKGTDLTIFVIYVPLITAYFIYKLLLFKSYAPAVESPLQPPSSPPPAVGA